MRRCLEKDRARRFQSADDIAMCWTSFQTSLPPQPNRRRRSPESSRCAFTALASPNRRVRDHGCLSIAAWSWLPGRWRPWPFGSARPRITRFAVLPLTNLSNDAEQEYFADGMTDILIADLTEIGSLRVISRTSVMQFKDAKKPLPEIAKQLGVDAIVTASVMKSGPRVRITAQLVDGSTDQHLWAKSYERELSDVLAMQGEVARAIAG